MVTGQMLTNVSRQSLQSTKLFEVMTPLMSFPSFDADLPLFEALERMDSEGPQIVAVVREGVPIGLLTRIEIVELIRSSRRRR